MRLLTKPISPSMFALRGSLSLPTLSLPWIGAIGACLILVGVTVGLLFPHKTTDQSGRLSAHTGFGRPHSSGFPTRGAEIAHLEIGATPEQRGRIEALYQANDLKRKPLHALLREKMRAYNALFEHYEIDTQQQEALREEIVRTQSDLLQIQLDTERELRLILNPEQFASMVKLLHQNHRRPFPSPAR